MQFNLIFGDWEGDGHGVTERHTVDVNIWWLKDDSAIRERIRDNYLRNVATLGYGLEELWEKPFHEALVDLHRAFGVRPALSQECYDELGSIFEGKELDTMRSILRVAEPGSRREIVPVAPVCHVHRFDPIEGSEGEWADSLGVEVCREVYVEDMIPLSMVLFLDGIEGAAWKRVDVKDYLFGSAEAIADTGAVAYDRLMP